MHIVTHALHYIGLHAQYKGYSSNANSSSIQARSTGHRGFQYSNKCLGIDTSNRSFRWAKKDPYKVWLFCALIAYPIWDPCLISRFAVTKLLHPSHIQKTNLSSASLQIFKGSSSPEGLERFICFLNQTKNQLCRWWYWVVNKVLKCHECSAIQDWA